MTQIQPVQLGLAKKEGVSIEVKPINIQLFTDSCGSYWQIFDIDGSQVDEGNLDIPAEIYLNWGDDDNIIVNYVLETLKLNRI